MGRLPGWGGGGRGRDNPKKDASASDRGRFRFEHVGNRGKRVKRPDNAYFLSLLEGNAGGRRGTQLGESGGRRDEDQTRIRGFGLQQRAGDGPFSDNRGASVSSAWSLCSTDPFSSSPSFSLPPPVNPGYSLCFSPSIQSTIREDNNWIIQLRSYEPCESLFCLEGKRWSQARCIYIKFPRNCRLSVCNRPESRLCECRGYEKRDYV